MCTHGRKVAIVSFATLKIPGHCESHWAFNLHVWLKLSFAELCACIQPKVHHHIKIKRRTSFIQRIRIEILFLNCNGSFWAHEFERRKEKKSMGQKRNEERMRTLTLRMATKMLIHFSHQRNRNSTAKSISSEMPFIFICLELTHYWRWHIDQAMAIPLEVIPSIVFFFYFDCGKSAHHRIAQKKKKGLLSTERRHSVVAIKTSIHTIIL